MDIATLVGLVLAMGLMLSGIGMENLQFFIDIPSLGIVAGGTVASLLINYPLGTVISVFGVAKNTVLFKAPDITDAIDKMVDFATVGSARRLVGFGESDRKLQ